MKFLAVILSFLFPPLAVIIAGKGIGHVLLNVLLTIFGVWVLGVIHAMCCVASMSSDWRSLPPTEKQIRYARDLGIRFKTNKVTRGSLSDMISEVTGE